MVAQHGAPAALPQSSWRLSGEDVDDSLGEGMRVFGHENVSARFGHNAV